MSGGDVPRGQWSHVAVTRSGNNYRLFINGVEVANTRYASALRASPERRVVIGHYGSDWGWSATAWFSGYMHQVRIHSGMALPSGGYTPLNLGTPQ